MRRFEVLDSPCKYLQQLKWNDKLAVAVSLERVRNEGLISNLGLYCFQSPNHIHEYSLKVLTSRNFPFLKELDHFIEMATESGLIMKWLKGCRFTSIYEKKPLYEYAEVKLELFICFILIVICLLLFSCFIAFLEKTAHNQIHVANVKLIWRYIEMAINPHRYFMFGYTFDLNKHDHVKSTKPRKVRFVRVNESLKPKKIRRPWKYTR